MSVSDPSSGVDGSTLVFKDVCVRLGGKEILRNVSGMAKVNQTLAIMGPSGECEWFHFT